MTSSVAHVALPVQTESGSGLIWRIAWRNLWRNRRRTWLTAGGIAFASLLVTASMALQNGSYASMIENSTGFFHGHAQISNAAYVDDEKLEHSVLGATELVRRLSAMPGIHVSPRAEAFALISVGERSFGGLVLGVDFAAEQATVNFLKNMRDGRLPENSSEVVIGTTMARNLGASIGDELIILGTAKQGGVAASALTISGLFSSGQVELDRTLVFADLSEVQNAFALGDEVHSIVIRVDDFSRLDEELLQIRAQLSDALVVRSWQALLPEVTQGIEIDRVSARLMYGAILILVSFSVINTFLMIVFERTREFGMLLAIGMRPGTIMCQVLLEAFFVWVVGVLIGLILSNLVVGYYAYEGIAIAGMEEMAKQFYMEERMYPAISLASLIVAPLVLLIGTQIAAFIATLRIRRLRPVTALRHE
jgi:ABC-type lipoprotein release transport system permease subunit